mgnify:CR=1 FL=1
MIVRVVMTEVGHHQRRNKNEGEVQLFRLDR